VTAARRQEESLEDEIIRLIVDVLVEDIAARPDLYGVDPAFFGLKPPAPEPPPRPSARRAKSR